MDYTTPPSYGSTRVSVGGLATDAGVTFAGIAQPVVHTEVKGDPEAQWPEPGAIKGTWEGKTVEGKQITAVIDTVLAERRDRVDVMAEVPGFIKTIVSAAAGTRPYIYQVCTSVVNLQNHPLALSPISMSGNANIDLIVVCTEDANPSHG
jgi:hypothetical protein